jgi:hypothetical protein
MGGELLRDGQVDVADQAQAQCTVGIDPVPAPKPTRSQELVHWPSSYP